MDIDDTAFSELTSAVIVQAAMDYVEAYKAGFIAKGGRKVNARAIESRVRCGTRFAFPKWLQPSDIYSAVWFLFQSHALDDIMPSSWEVSPESIRLAIVATTRTSKTLTHF